MGSGKWSRAIGLVVLVALIVVVVRRLAAKEALTLAFDRPWQIVGLIVLAVLLRLAIQRVPGSGRWRHSVLEFDDSVLVAVLLVFCVVRPFAIQTFYIPSDSMLPTLEQGDRILVLKFWFRAVEPKPGDIVVFRAPKAAYYSNPAENPDLNVPKDFIKRLVGTPGDRLRVKDSQLYRNGQAQAEPYIKWPPDIPWPGDGEHEVVVPPNQFVVMGDNRRNSNDSTRWELPTYGPDRVNGPFVSREMLLGKAWVIFWPVTRIRVLH